MADISLGRTNRIYALILLQRQSAENSRQDTLAISLGASQKPIISIVGGAAVVSRIPRTQ